MVMTNRSGRKTQANPDESQPNGFFGRFKQRGYKRVLLGVDLYIALSIGLIALLLDEFTLVEVVNPDLVSNSVPVSIALVSFILIGISILVSFSSEEFLKLLHDLGIYNTILFNFEFTIHLSIAVTIYGVILQTYSTGLQLTGQYSLLICLYIFVFVYMILSVANLVSLVVSLGKQKAKYEKVAD